MDAMPHPLTRVPPEDRTLLSIFESVIGPRDEELSARDRELVKAILEAVRLQEGHEVYAAHYPIEVYPSFSQEEWETKREALGHERVVMETRQIGSQGFDRSDESFVYEAAGSIRGLMVKGKPFIIYRILPYTRDGGGHRGWVVRCAVVK